MYSIKMGYIKFVLIGYLTCAFLWQSEAGLIPGQMQENKWRARWLGGRASDSGARGPEFEPHDRRVVSLSKTL